MPMTPEDQAQWDLYMEEFRRWMAANPVFEAEGSRNAWKDPVPRPVAPIPLQGATEPIIRAATPNPQIGGISDAPPTSTPLPFQTPVIEGRGHPMGPAVATDPNAGQVPGQDVSQELLMQILAMNGMVPGAQQPGGQGARSPTDLPPRPASPVVQQAGTVGSPPPEPPPAIADQIAQSIIAQQGAATAQIPPQGARSPVDLPPKPPAAPIQVPSAVAAQAQSAPRAQAPPTPTPSAVAGPVPESVVPPPSYPYAVASATPPFTGLPPATETPLTPTDNTRVASQGTPWDQLAQQGDMPPGLLAGEPTTPEQVEQRKSGWKAFMEKVKSDPNLQLMFMTIGTQMMQPVPAGQSAAGHLGQAVQKGVGVKLQRDDVGFRQEAVTKRGERRERLVTEAEKTGELARDLEEKRESRVERLFDDRFRLQAAQVENVENSNRLQSIAITQARAGEKYADRIAKAGIERDEAMIKYYGDLGEAAINKAAVLTQDKMIQYSKDLALVNKVNQIAIARHLEEVDRFGEDKAKSIAEILSDMFIDPNSSGMLKAYAENHALLGIAMPEGVTPPAGAGSPDPINIDAQVNKIRGRGADGKKALGGATSTNTAPDALSP